MSLLNRYDYSSLNDADREKLCRRPGSAGDLELIHSRVSTILNDVRLNKDAALRSLALELDGVALEKLWYDDQQIARAASQVSGASAAAIEKAYSNIYTYHASQTFNSSKVETSAGVECWRERRPITSVGLYVPGGSAVLPSTLMMLGIPARIAGVSQIVVCSPPQAGGAPNPYLAYVARLLGLDKMYLAGGAQAIAAMAFGTQSIPATSKIFGPGNRFVTLAKQLVQLQAPVSIDMPAGPSEVLIIADSGAEPSFVAADLLAQAEHGPDSQVVLVTDSLELAAAVQEELDIQLSVLDRKDLIYKSLSHSFIIIVNSIKDAFDFSNRYAPEHLILCISEARTWIPAVTSAGSVFVGEYAPESAGDYASGTNHTLPTAGYAKMYSGVSVDSFSKQISFQEISSSGLLALGPTIVELASIEGLTAHGKAVTLRTDRIKSEMTQDT